MRWSRSVHSLAGLSGLVIMLLVGSAFPSAAPTSQDASSRTAASDDTPDPSQQPVELGSRLELMAGTQIIDSMNGSELQLNSPTRREVVMSTDKPWEGSASHYRQVFKDGDTYRMYYLGLDYDVRDGAIHTSHPGTIAYAESDDGINWTRPNLGLVEFEGSTDNNIVAGLEMSHTYVFKDANPDAASDAQYKAMEVRDGALYALKSSDGLEFEPMSDEPIFTDGAFDSLNVAFWDAERDEYRMYFRVFNEREEGEGSFRAIRTTTSEDFLDWEEAEDLEYPGSSAPEDQLYTNNVTPYYRAPHVFVGFPMRYVEPEGWMEYHDDLPGREHRQERYEASPRYGTAMTDTLFMSSRDGTTFDRPDEAFIRPGPAEENWKYGDNSVAWGLVETESHIDGAPDELSIYATEGYWTGDELDVVRYSMRVDGFASVNAPYSGGEFVTKPVRFSGDELALNMATSAAGSLRVEIQNPGGQPIDGFSLEDSDALVGDDLERIVSWGGESDLSALEGRPVRLRFVLEDADLFSLRFQSASE